ncbi:MAG: bifunctional diaminohydroxyphosphoribosylaminopyrimidine deaminase/5-amino-6-(5-phosphoribosylamino)uracil reductase RibD [Ignavibacteriales bacterium]|nr:bifunctional diaminohydroxyphosphoribosylaminopyrimidine deaminase/5-amino-6-(5-phosphoribosylamino)uracil reductase RibD [Ignavibacteriales bacterium]
MRYMKLALALAKKGKGKVSPNPMVGCVIVNNGEVVGKGHHEFFGGPHAEVNALREAGDKAGGSTLYVTLEPCNHFGKTPPCTDAIIKAGVSRVVAAVRDPNPKMKGRGLERLKRKSIEVSEGILAEEARRVNSSYFKMRRYRGRKVIIKFAMSIDGKIATRTGDSKWISSNTSREYVHRLRTDVDAVIVGANTALRDDPGLTSHGMGRNPVRIVIDPRLKVPLNRRVFDGTAPTIVFHSSTNTKGKLTALRKRRILAVRLHQRNDKIKFQDIIARLNDYSIFKVLIEGGGETIASVLEAGVVTDILVFISPKIIGGKSAITPVEGLGVAEVKNALQLLDTNVRKIGTDFLLHARVARPKQEGRG